MSRVWRRRHAATAVVGMALTLTCSAGAAAAARPRGPQVVELPVAFAVTNSNTSGVPCSSDGARYTVRGHLVATRERLSAPMPKTVTVYLHDFGIGEWFWRFRAVPGYDFTAGMARSGHIGLVIDELGYGASEHPSGTSVCLGSQADALHQVIGRLRRGDYTGVGRRAPSFSRVVVAGHSTGAQIGEIEAYSYKDVTGLAILGYADRGSSQTAQQQALSAGVLCAAGGQPQNGTDGPPGYVYYEQSPEEFASSFFAPGHADPRVVSAATARRSRGPCGDLESIAPGIAVDETRLGEITVPVLLVYGANDAAFPASGEADQRQSLSGTHDVASYTLPGTGHAFTLERTAPLLTRDVGGWLARHWRDGRARTVRHRTPPRHRTGGRRTARHRPPHRRVRRQDD
jgi:pimeloyl-ACP methyl ester carboxylesterase